MSVVIVVKVSEGLVLGADSAATISGKVSDGTEEHEGILKTFFNARKLLQIGDFPIGVLTWGNAFIGLRTIESLVREWEYDNKWQSREIYEKYKKDTNGFSVRECATSLSNHLHSKYKDEFGDVISESSPKIGFIVAGYSHRGFFPEIWRFVIPLDKPGEICDQRPDKNGKPDFGASWFGLTDAMVRLHHGFDERAVKIIIEKFGIPEQDVRKAFAPLQYNIPFPVMPLQDAIDYTCYMLNVATGRFRFVIGPELCGGQIDIAAITQQKLEWIAIKKRSMGKGDL